MPKRGKQKGPKNNGSKPRGKFATTIHYIATFIAAGILALSIFIAFTIVIAKPISIENFESTDSTVVLDANGNVIYDLGAKLVENVDYEEIPQSLVDAFVAVEDSRFFEHGGFDSPRFTIAMTSNVLKSLAKLRLSFDAGGASTIDMQLARNAMFLKENVVTGESELPPSRGLEGIQRKIQEVYYAKQINNKKLLSKKVIFQNYLNKNNYGTGHNMIGVQRSKLLF